MRRLLVGSVIGLVVLGGCGGSSSSSGGGSGGSSASSGGGTTVPANAGTVLNLSADPQQLKYNVNHLSAKAGKVTIVMKNPSPLQHDIAIKGGANAQGPVVGQGGTSVVTLTLKPGKYTFYCTVDSHESAGMNGELDIK